MKKYSKVIDGELVIKPANEIFIEFNNIMYFLTTDKEFSDNGWTLYEQDEEDILKDLEEAKKNKINEILSYDSSENVNIFYINDNKLWLDKSTRVGLKLRFESELDKGVEYTNLWYDNKLYEIPITEAINMLHLIELYASKCYDITQENIQIVNNFKNINDVINFNYEFNYPEKLKFKKGE